MKQISLSGDWQLHQLEETQVSGAIPALVPGCVHMDLLRAGKLEDPFYRDNEARQYWIGESNWTYERTFTVPAELFQNQRVLLHCFGLDTLATVEINGAVVGIADNMYRTWLFDVKNQLKAGENTISVRFDAPMNYLREQDARNGKLPSWAGNDRLHGVGWLRKEPSNFGWDWGPKLVTSGIWREIEIIGYDERLTEIAIRQQHSSDKVDLAIQVGVENPAGTTLTARVEVSLDGAIIASADVPVGADGASAALTISEPKLWWVHGLGEQPLYSVRVQLINASGQVIDEQSKHIGLRTITLERHPDAQGESFYFAVNGVPFFAKGADWIPADTFVPRLTAENYERLIADAADANMNMLRVWGGGVYEQDVFYDLCDQYGIAIWQDFMFACGTYPTYDAEFMKNVRAEAEDNVRHLRHHACMALWCGNNEMEQGLVGDEWTERTMSWKDYDKLYEVLLREVVQTNDPDGNYWPSSPHKTANRVEWMNPNTGDSHLWSVWHGREPFEWYRTRQDRFVSEFGFQSFPEPATLEPFIESEDRNITSYMMEYRQRSGIGNSTIIHYLLSWFRLPNSFEHGIWLSQIQQGMAIKYAVEHWRRNMPHTMGTLYWQLNDCWPGPSWSSIDSLYRWKALHYMAKRFYAPLMISGLEDAAKGTVEVHVTSDLLAAQDAVVGWKLCSTSGELLDSGELSATLPAAQDTLVTTFDLNNALQKQGIRNLLIVLELRVNGATISENLVLFARPKHLTLVEPNIQFTVRQVDENQFQVELTAEHPALWAWISTADGKFRYSDNFFNLMPGSHKIIDVTTQGSASVEQVQSSLRVRSLIDTSEEVESTAQPS
ncbi:MAG: glycoside hydrolase family 2 protein [Chloroflexi bacterium]|nr:glycoside hydrolase family 2 protein [Chloroflexota bacterium]